MIKYMAVTLVLKAFSFNKMSRLAYRNLGNILGEKRRQRRNINDYIERGDLLVDAARKYGLLDKKISAVEIGTGWMHWYGLYLALQSEKSVQLELFDVWDNRQFNALRSAFSDLEKRWKADPKIDKKKCDRISNLLTATSFHELYRKFNANYKLDETGSLASYRDNYYDTVFSFHVLEHVRRDIIQESIGHMHRMLKPGGLCIHQIGIDDHLAHYDRSASKKQYLEYSIPLRKHFFENDVQYHNGLQAGDFLYYFRCQKFEIVELHREKIDLSNVSVHDDWKGYSLEDLETVILTVVCRKSKG